MGDYQRLQVWKKAHALTEHVYCVIRGFPPDERFELSAQLRRAAVSVESNIIEGCGRRNDRELRRYLGIARGSVKEVEGQLRIARDVGLLGEESWNRLHRETGEISKMLTGLMNYLKGRIQPSSGP